MILQKVFNIIYNITVFTVFLIKLISVRLFFQKLKSKNTKEIEKSKIIPFTVISIVCFAHMPFNPLLEPNHDSWTLHRQQGRTCLNTAPLHNQDICIWMWKHSRELLQLNAHFHSEKILFPSNLLYHRVRWNIVSLLKGPNGAGKRHFPYEMS